MPNGVNPSKIHRGPTKRIILAKTLPLVTERDRVSTT